MKYLQLVLLIFALLACSVNDDPSDNMEPSNIPYQIVNDFSYNELLSQIGQERLARGIEKPRSDGALGRNKNAYFHVRFQINMTSIADFVIVSERLDALQSLAATISYSLDRQLSDGSFEFNPPADLVNAPDYRPATMGDLASGTSFFCSSLGLSLIALQNSDWFLNSQETQAIKVEIESYRSSFEKTLDYLISQKDLLKQYDAHAPNRLLFDALAYYSLGKYLSRIDAQNIAFEFIEAALELTDAQEGYFIENGGWDSSYNGVAIKLGFELLSLIDNEAQKMSLKKVLAHASNWQISRINENGEVSTEGNTRVFPGGEAFLGEEKGIDYPKIVKALYYFGYLTSSQDIVRLGDTVLDFYN